MLPYKNLRTYDAGGDISKDWFVSYYFLKPKELQKANEPVYQRFKVFESINSIKTVKGRFAQLKRMEAALKDLLESGFSPFQRFEYRSAGKYDISECIHIYLQEVKPDLKKRSYDLYNGRLNFFKAYLEEIGRADIDLSDLSKQMIFDFVKKYQIERKWSNKTYNHYLQAIGTFLQYFVDNYDGYLTENVCDKIKRLQVYKRGNRPFTNSSFKKSLEWMRDNDYFMYQFCRFIYYSCMRPDAELRLLQIKHIDLVGRKIMVPHGNAKSKITQYIPIDDEFYEIIAEMNLDKYNRDRYVFGLKEQPQPKPVSEKYFRKRFLKVRANVRIEEHVTMYSYKHTRCIHLVEDGEKLHNIIKITRHKTLAELMDYLKDMGVILGDDVRLKSRRI